jgi:hypothetical protein
MPPSCSSAALGSIHWSFATTRHVLLSLNATGIYWSTPTLQQQTASNSHNTNNTSGLQSSAYISLLYSKCPSKTSE